MGSDFNVLYHSIQDLQVVGGVF